MRLILFMAIVWTCTATRAESLFTFSNVPGAHGVGVRYVKQYDRTRSFTPDRGMLAAMLSKNRGRPLQTVMWYPTEKSGRQGIRYDEYLQLVGWGNRP